MAATERRPISAMVQDTGNPVLDTTANLAMALVLAGRLIKVQQEIDVIHQTVLKLAKSEPGGLKRRAPVSV